MKYKSDFINEISSRGFIYQSSDIENLDKIMSQSSIVGYIGFDITSDSLHVGSLVQLMLLYWMQKFGHKPIALMGGGTTLVGDPSGKDKQRKILSKEEIEKNIKNIETTFKYFIDFEKGAKIINNYDWLSELNYISFLREIGQKITINRMLTFESIKSRLDREQPLSFLEFNYMLLQAYDFLYLNREFKCSLQMGGSDQWGNIITGIELIKKISDKDAFAITSPLITNSDGSKMGKTAEGAIWLDKNKLSDFDFYQYWRNTDDKNVVKFLKLFTTLPIKEIEKLSKLKNQEINEAKKILSFEITKLCRGIDSAQNALDISNNVFDKNVLDKRINSVSIEMNDLISNKVTIIDALERLDLVKSRSEAKRLIQSKGIKVNDNPYTIENHNLYTDYTKDIKGNTMIAEIKIAVGKKKIGIVKVTNKYKLQS